MARLKESESLSEAAAQTAEKLNVISEHETSKKADIEKKKRTAQNKRLINFRWAEDRIDRYSKFFGARGLSLSKGVLMCVEDEIFRAENNRIDISETGIRENRLAEI